jgi:hypothetical protein
VFATLVSPVTRHQHIRRQFAALNIRIIFGSFFEEPIVNVLVARDTLWTVTVDNFVRSTTESVIESGFGNIFRHFALHTADVGQARKLLDLKWRFGIVVVFAFASTTAAFKVFLKLCTSKSICTPGITCFPQAEILLAFFVQIAALATPAIAAIFLLEFFAGVTFQLGPCVAGFAIASLWTFVLVTLDTRFVTVKHILGHAASVNFVDVALYLLPTRFALNLNASSRSAHDSARRRY